MPESTDIAGHIAAAAGPPLLPAAPEAAASAKRLYDQRQSLPLAPLLQQRRKWLLFIRKWMKLTV